MNGNAVGTHAGLLPGSEFEVQVAGISHVFNAPDGRWGLDRCAIPPTCSL